jgi:ureidoacrylate peracid hydrolase
MVRFDIVPRRTALLIIDMMNAFLKPGAPLEIPKGRQLIPDLNRLIKLCREKEILVVFIVHAHRQNGRDMGLYSTFVPAMANSSILVEEILDVEINDEIDRKENDVVVIKRSFSGFFGTDPDLILKINEIDTLIISGVATHSCCEATARDARHRNYKVIFLSDGTAT